MSVPGPSRNPSGLRRTRSGRSLAAALRRNAAPAARRFENALAAPEQAQRARLAAVLRRVAGSRQARGIRGFERIRAGREFQDAVPLATPDGLRAQVEEAMRDVPAVLSHDRVVRFERSGGTTRASKFVPHTRALLAEFHAAVEPWLFDLARSHPDAWGGPGYWSISPLAQPRDHTPGGIPVGGGDDGAYFPAAIRRVLAGSFAVPPAVALLPDVESCRYVTLRVLLQHPDLALASAWNPSFLTLLLETLDRHSERLLDDLAAGACRPPEREDEPGSVALRVVDRDPRRDPGRAIATRAGQILAVLERVPFRADPQRARTLRASLASAGRFEAHALWPRLALVSVWTDAQAARALPALRARLPRVEFQGKGLLATEGVVSIPWSQAPAPVLAVRSHFFEFLDPDAPDRRPRLAHELETGTTYEVVMSTSAGFLRCRTGDLVRVVEHYRATPCLRFEGRADAVSDLVGEKLSASRVSAVLSRVLPRDAAAPGFAMLAPEWSEPPAYHLFVESAAGSERLEQWAGRLEAELAEGFSYRYARSLGQLGPVRPVRVHDAARRYEAGCVSLGQRAGDVKPVDLDLRTGWLARLAATAAERVTAQCDG